MYRTQKRKLKNVIDVNMIAIALQVLFLALGLIVLYLGLR